jgi:hypothetical protein
MVPDAMVQLPVAALALSGVVASLAMDRLAEPGGAGLSRPGPAFAIHAGLFTSLWSLLWLISHRPVFAIALTLAGQYLVIAVSNAKFRALREPFLFSDFGLFSQALRFPRLYLPFLGMARATAVGLGLIAAVAIGLALEEPWPVGWVPASALLVCGLILLLTGSRLASAPSLDPVTDLATAGLVPNLWLYWQAERTALPTPPARPWLEDLRVLDAAQDPADLPDLVLVQSESFFDTRRLYAGVRPSILRHFDTLVTHALAHGRLDVPAWGANTMRTEFAALTGIPEGTLGVHRFNPYRRVAKAGRLALPQQLRSLGYRTVCIHPHPAGFFGRDRIFPKIGFDVFLDIGAFTGAARVGPYIGDAAVMAKIAEILGAATRPTFVFVITMENHGPLHLERVAPGDVDRLYQTPPQAGWQDLTVYLRHLANADQMLGDLAELLRSRQRPGLLCWFGDHVPSLPKVYDDLRFTDARTDYLIWSGSGGEVPALDLSAHDLPEALLAALAEMVHPTENCDVGPVNAGEDRSIGSLSVHATGGATRG